jgi:hypothetical protein
VPDYPAGRTSRRSRDTDKPVTEKSSEQPDKSAKPADDKTADDKTPDPVKADSKHCGG